MKPGRPPRRDFRRKPQKSFAPRSPEERRPDALFVYGIHPVLAALANPKRRVRRIVATPNALARLAEAGAALPLAAEEASPRDLDRLVGGDAVHQGVALEVEPLDPPALESLGEAKLLVVLDQVTDPHNVGAILRSAAAFAADAVVTTARYAPAESGVLAKAASGALDAVPLVHVQNLARALGALAELGFVRIGLDSEAEAPVDAAIARAGPKIAIVLGAEGRGLRRLTRDTCDTLCRIETAGPIASLNVSNAAALALYLARRRLGEAGA